MYIDFLIDVFQRHPLRDAIVWRDQVVSYAGLQEAIQRWRLWLHDKAVAPGTVVSLEADFSPNSVALLLALVERGCIIVPLTDSVEVKKPEFRQIAEVEVRIAIGSDDRARVLETSEVATNALLRKLKTDQRPGLILFSSGSSGKNKAAVHDLVPLLEKFRISRHSKRTITFMLFDHIGGVNTLLYTLSNAGCIVTVQDRSPDAVCETIEAYKVEILPTSPTFINLLLFRPRGSRGTGD